MAEKTDADAGRDKQQFAKTYITQYNYKPHFLVFVTRNLLLDDSSYCCTNAADSANEVQ